MQMFRTSSPVRSRPNLVAKFGTCAAAADGPAPTVTIWTAAGNLGAAVDGTVPGSLAED